METVVDATIPTDQFVLEEAVERVPDVELEFLRFAVHDSGSAMPFLRGSTSKPDRLEAALRDDPCTERVSHLSSGDGRGLYAVEWTGRALRLIDGLAEALGPVLAVRGTADRWTVRILFPDRATASETFRAWCDEDISPSLSRISDLSCRTETTGGISTTQHSAIAEAFRNDYYNVPRGTTLKELAAELEVSHQALSERLRRGHSHLVERMLSESATVPNRQQ